MALILIILVGAFAFCIFGLICSLKATTKRKNLQEQADYNFKNTNGNYQFYYSIKSFKKETMVISRIFVEPVLGFSDLNHADTNSFSKIEIFINDILIKSTVEKKGLSAMCEFIFPAEYVVDGEINTALTINTFWCLGGENIKDTLTFTYGKSL